MRTQLLRLSLAAVLAVAAATAAQAQTFPSKPFRFIVPFPAGGATDAAARAMQPQLEKIFGQTVVIDNRAGAGAVIGLDAIAKSAPDGHTFGIGPAGAMSVNPAMQVKMPFDVRKDLTAISGLAQTPFILAAPASFPANTLQEVIAKAKAAARHPDHRARRQWHLDVLHRAAVHHHGRREDGPRPVPRHRAGGDRPDRRPHRARHRRSAAGTGRAPRRPDQGDRNLIQDTARPTSRTLRPSTSRASKATRSAAGSAWSDLRAFRPTSSPSSTPRWSRP